MRGVLRAGTLWVALTVVVVLGVTQAIQSVQRDVIERRPVPLSSEEVEHQVRVRAGTTSTTAGRATPTTAPSETRRRASATTEQPPGPSTSVPAADDAPASTTTTVTSPTTTTTAQPGAREGSTGPHAPASPPTSAGGPSSGTSGR